MNNLIGLQSDRNRLKYAQMMTECQGLPLRVEAVCFGCPVFVVQVSLYIFHVEFHAKLYEGQEARHLLIYSNSLLGEWYFVEIEEYLQIAHVFESCSLSYWHGEDGRDPQHHNLRYYYSNHTRIHELT